MPQMVTHYQFGLDASNLLDLPDAGATPAARAAYLLGNQGPDPFFFTVLCPGRACFTNVGDLLHEYRPASFLGAAARYAQGLVGNRAALARSFVAGLASHYILDRNIHPLVYFWVEAILAEDVGLTREDEDYVHTEIERDFDEMMLFSRFGATVETVKPGDFVLRTTPEVLECAGEVVSFALQEVYGLEVAPEVYEDAVRAWRTFERVIWSPTGKKRSALAAFERKISGGNSFIAGLSLHPRAEDMSVFDNHDHRPWRDPFTGAVRCESFDDLFMKALSEIAELVELLSKPDFDMEELFALTGGLNYSSEHVGEQRCELPEELNPYLLSTIRDGEPL